ncbi:hypothetical protein IP86_20970 [Rhodopseudomonas sp. AAP120]|nr:hypothetical protein IP86_20970 [Rhodopseudomonas sp. AAP120]
MSATDTFCSVLAPVTHEQLRDPVLYRSVVVVQGYVFSIPSVTVIVISSWLALASWYSKYRAIGAPAPENVRVICFGLPFSMVLARTALISLKFRAAAGEGKWGVFAC